MAAKKYDCSRCINYKYIYSVGSPYENYCTVTDKPVPLQHMQNIKDKSEEDFFQICNYIKMVNLT